MIQVIIYGDSIMKGATPEGASKYRSVLPRFLPRLAEKYDLAVTNRSRFGCTIDRGYAMLQKDLQEKTPCQIALVEYGGTIAILIGRPSPRTPRGSISPKPPLSPLSKPWRSWRKTCCNGTSSPCL